MPPKKKATEPTKKTVEKQKAKVIEDKTFGLKNKKGAKQQKFIKTVVTQVQHGGKSAKQLEKDKQEKLSKKEQKKKELEELNALLKPVQTIAKGVDPKSVLCAFFKQGTCGKGDKCKFSHDLNISRKGEKKSIYTDVREEEAETMEDWDEAKLEEVVSKKHGESNKAKTTTSIICKFFLEAVENSKYGWFWHCPNGDMCKYRHALPPGFMLKKDRKKDDKESEISMEELVEKERACLGDKLTKVTLETFLQWKERKRKEKVKASKAVNDKKKSDFKQGKMLGISGREMFTYNPDLVAGDDEEADDIVYTREQDDEEDEAIAGQVREINLEVLAAQAQEANDKNITVAPSDRRKPQQNGQDLPNGTIDDDESNKLGMAAALPDPNKDTDAAIAAAIAATVDGDVLAGDTPIDENLFDGEDLDLVEDELETLDLDD